MRKFNWLGHQSLFDRPPAAVARCGTGVPDITGQTPGFSAFSLAVSFVSGFLSSAGVGRFGMMMATATAVPSSTMLVNARERLADAGMITPSVVGMSELAAGA